MGRKSRQEKLAEYVLDGSVSKFRRFLKEHKRIDVNSVRLAIHKYQPLLHMACERGHHIMVDALLQAGADPSLLDYAREDTALHVALRRVLSGHPHDFKHLILAILKYSPSDILDIENKSGQTARHLLKRYVSEQGMTVGHKVRTEDDKWREKLSDAFEDDMNDDVPDHSYYEGFGEGQSEQECFDMWADRLAAEHRAKRSCGNPFKHEEDPKKRKRPEHEHRRRKKVRGPNMKDHVLVMRLRYEKRMTAFEAKTPDQISYEDVPWPGGTDNTEHMVAILVGNRSKRNMEELKKYIKTQQRTWHPDKFTQKFGAHLKEGDRDRILEKVNELSQALNKAGDEEPKDEWE